MSVCMYVYVCMYVVAVHIRGWVRRVQANTIGKSS